MTPYRFLHARPCAAVSLIILLFITACTVTEARPTSIPTVVTPTPEATAVPSETAPPTLTPLPTHTPLPGPTAVPAEFSRPTHTPTAVSNLPTIPTENSLTLTLQDQFGGNPGAVLVDGSTVFLAVGPRLVAVDVSDPTSPRFLSQSPVLGDQLMDIVLQEPFIYGAAGSAGLVVFDVSEPASIQLINAGPNYAGANPPNAQRVISSGGRIFITNANYGNSQTDLIWFDQAAGQPAFAGSMPLKDETAFSATSDLLFIGTKTGVQVANPQNPVQPLSQLGPEQEIYRLATAVRNNLLYLAMQGPNTEVALYDLSDPTNPKPVTPNQPVPLEYFTEFAINDHVLASSITFGEFGYCNGTLTIVDISQPTDPQKTAEFDPKNCISDLAGSEELLFVTGLSGLQIFSTSDPAHLELLGQYTNPGGVQSVEDFLPGQPTSYLISNEGRGSFIAAVNVAEGTQTFLGKTEPQPNHALLELFQFGQTLIATAWNSGLLAFDISNPGQLTQLFAPPLESEGLGSLHSTALVENIIYLPVQEQFAFTGSLGAFDLQDPTNPQMISTFKSGLDSFESLVHADGYLYVLGGYEPRSVVIVDVRQPLAPVVVSTFSFPDQVSRLAVIGQTLYAMCDGYRCQSFTAVDISDVERPLLINEWFVPFDVLDSATDGSYLYTISANNIVRALDIRQPDQPRIVGTIDLPGGSPSLLTIIDNSLYVSAGPAGLMRLTMGP